MKTLILCLACLCAAWPLRAQDRLSVIDALGQLYSGFDPDHSTAQWVCTKEQEDDSSHPGWPCWKEYVTVQVSVELMAEVGENGTDKVYLVASAKPAGYPEGYTCHACQPAIGAAVFVAQEGNWALQSSNPAIGFYGGWGDSPRVDLVRAGPDKRGFMLSKEDIAQGYAWSTKVLLLPFNRTVVEAWSIEDEQDNAGAIDPTDKLNKQQPYHSSAAFRFYAPDSDHVSFDDYYDIEVISRGKNTKGPNASLKPEDWTEIYRLEDGKYRLLRHTEFIEVKNPPQKPRR